MFWEKNLDNDIKQTRVVITGIGMISPFGIGKDLLWEGLVNGRSAIKKISRFDTSFYTSHLGGEVDGYDPGKIDADARFSRLPLVSQYALAASDMVIIDGNLRIDREKSDDIGIFFGSQGGPNESCHQFLEDLVKKGSRLLKPLLFQETVFNAPSSLICIKHGITGPHFAIASEFVSGMNAIETAINFLKMKRINYALVGAADIITEIQYSAFHHLKTLAHLEGAMVEISRPFDRCRNGFIYSEGAAFLLLETFENAMKRDAKIYGEIIGIGSAHDMNKSIINDPTGNGIARSMKNALRSARLNKDNIDYIIALADSTQRIDLAETRAIQKVFGDRTPQIPISSIKSSIGETLSVDGFMNIFGAIMSLETDRLIPTINCEMKDDESNLDIVIEKREKNIKTVLCNSYYFGGNNSSVIIQKV